MWLNTHTIRKESYYKLIESLGGYRVNITPQLPKRWESWVLGHNRWLRMGEKSAKLRSTVEGNSCQKATVRRALLEV
jgi:hypothetical protein